MTAPRIAHVQMGAGGGTERFFVNLVHAFAEAGATQMVGLREGVDYADAVRDVADLVQGPMLRVTPGGLWARRRWFRALERFAPDAIIGWRAPTARLIPDRPGPAKLVRLGDFPRHVRHLAHLDAVVCNMPGIAEHLEHLGHPGRTEIISNFPRPLQVSPVERPDLSTPDGAYVICGSARFAPNKGIDTLVRAAAQVPDAWLWLIGDGPERVALEALVASLGLGDRTRFVGWVAEPMTYIAAADCFVMPSRDEPLGNALIEAWHVGTPSITTATAGPRWYAQDGHDCLMVAVDDVPALALAITRLRQDRALAAQLRAGARATLERGFSRDAVVARYFQLIAEL